MERLINNRVGVSLVCLAVILAGLFLGRDLPVKLYPKTSKTRIQVRIPHAGMSAEDFEKNYGQRLSQALATIDGVDETETTYSNGSTRALIFFDWGFPGEEAKALVLAAMSGVRSFLPEESDRFSVRYWAGRSAGFIAIGIHSSEIDAKTLFPMIEPLIRPDLRKLKGVSRAELRNVEEIRVEIRMDDERALSLGLGSDQVVAAIRKGYRNTSLGTFKDGRQQFTVRVRRGVDDMDKIGDIVVAHRGTTLIRLRDVATVSVKMGLPRSLYSINGRQAIILFAMPDDSGNVRDIALQIRTIIDRAKVQLPQHVRFDYLVDPAVFIDNAIRNVFQAALVGGCLAILVVLLFLGELRNTLIVAVSVPLSIISSLILMALFGVSINLISLGGLTLAVGMIVDSSIVVLENIHRHRQQQETTLFAAVVAGVREVKGAVIAATLTSIVVFLPISFTSALTSAVLGDLARTVVFALASSVVVALVVVPCMIYVLFDGVPVAGRKGILSNLSGRLQRSIIGLYGLLLRRLLPSRFLSAGFILGALALLMIVITQLGPRIRKEIMAKPESSRITMRFNNFETRDEEALLAAIRPIEKRLLDRYKGKFTSLFARMHGANRGAFTITLPSPEIRDFIIKDLKKNFKSDRKWRFDIVRWDPSELPLPRTNDLKISVSGPSSEAILATMEKIADAVRLQGHYADVYTEPSTVRSQEVSLKPRLDVIEGTEGVTLAKLIAISKTLLTGTRVIEWPTEDDSLIINLESKAIKNELELRNYQVAVSGHGVPLKHFFDFSPSRGIAEIMNRDGDPVYQVLADLPEDSPMGTRQAVLQRLKQSLKKTVNLNNGTRFAFEDTRDVIDDAIASLLMALAVSVLLIYVILGAQFNRWLMPLVVLTTIPLGLIGVVGSLYLTDSSLSLNSMLGSILLGGVVVNNAILILDFYQQFKDDFGSRIEAIIHSCELRVIPILITTITTILGMLPIALALGEGTNVIQPLGIAVAGGLGVATLFTLFAIPCIIVLLAGRKKT